MGNIKFLVLLGLIILFTTVTLYSPLIAPQFINPNNNDFPEMFENASRLWNEILQLSKDNETDELDLLATFLQASRYIEDKSLMYNTSYYKFIVNESTPSDVLDRELEIVRTGVQILDGTGELETLSFINSTVLSRRIAAWATWVTVFDKTEFWMIKVERMAKTLVLWPSILETQARLIISTATLPFVLLSIGVYLILWNRRKNSHTWIQFSMILIILMHAVKDAVTMSYYIGCTTDAEFMTQSTIHFKGLFMGIYISYFGFTLNMLWVLVLNVDLWLSFRSFSLKRRTIDEKKKFLISFLSAVGTAAILTAAGHWLKQLTDTGFKLTRHGGLVYNWKIEVARISWSVILCLVNIILFTSTVRGLKKSAEETKVARRSSTASSDADQKCKLYARLFTLMIGTSLVKTFSYLIFVLRRYDKGLGFLSPMIPYLGWFNVLSKLEGVFILWVLTFNTRTFSQLREEVRKICSKNGRTDSGRITAASTTPSGRGKSTSQS